MAHSMLSSGGHWLQESFSQGCMVCSCVPRNTSQEKQLEQKSKMHSPRSHLTEEDNLFWRHRGPQKAGQALQHCSSPSPYATGHAVTPEDEPGLRNQLWQASSLTADGSAERHSHKGPLPVWCINQSWESRPGVSPRGCRPSTKCVSIRAARLAH